jgi:peptidyl-prolyl isomerase D
MLVMHTDLPWTSGAVYSKQEALQLGAAEKAREAAEQKRREDLRADLSLPIVYLDVTIKGEAAGRMEFVLFTREAPLAAENFRALCTCEKGTAPKGHTGEGKAYCFKVGPG